MKYPGGKNADGVYQRIINQIPPHRLYVELFLGSGAILRHKRPAEHSIGIDLDRDVLERVRPHAPPGTHFIHRDALDWIEGVEPCEWGQGTFLYADPPYLPETCGRQRYRHTLDREGHERLLELLCGLPAGVMVAISGYESRLYNDALLHRPQRPGRPPWWLIQYPVQTRGGPRIECLWGNYPAPTELHDYRYVGENYRQRQDFRRQQQRWRERLAKMPPLRRMALLAAIADNTAENPR